MTDDDQWKFTLKIIGAMLAFAVVGAEKIFEWGDCVNAGGESLRCFIEVAANKKTGPREEPVYNADDINTN